MESYSVRWQPSPLSIGHEKPVRRPSIPLRKSQLTHCFLPAKSASLEPWFPPHLQRNIYLSLLHLEQTDPSKEKPITVPDSILKTALLRRATEDIRRIISIRAAKQALSTLLARGSVGDDLWQRFLRAEKEMEEELKDVVTEVRPPHSLPMHASAG